MEGLLRQGMAVAARAVWTSRLLSADLLLLFHQLEGFGASNAPHLIMRLAAANGLSESLLVTLRSSGVMGTESVRVYVTSGMREASAGA